MRAYGTAGGGVMFVPDEIENIAASKVRKPSSEKKFLKKEPAAKSEKRFSLFGRRRKSEDALQEAA